MVVVFCFASTFFKTVQKKYWLVISFNNLQKNQLLLDNNNYNPEDKGHYFLSMSTKSTKTGPVKDLSLDLPDYHTIYLIDTAGNEIAVGSTYGKAGDKIKLDTCPLSHPAWNPSKSAINTKVDQVVKFASKNPNFSDKLSALLSPDKNKA